MDIILLMIVMGNYNQKVVISSVPNLMDAPNAWKSSEAKNADYYFSKQRFTKISRKHYPEYTSGYIYGYYYQPDYQTKLQCLISQMEDEQPEPICQAF